jgi:RNA polymerase sigma-70 factor (ECF subfamily)
MDLRLLKKTTPRDEPQQADSSLSFEQLYDAHASFVWRSARRLGVPDALVDDVVQDVFIIAYRRLATFEHRSSIKTWIFAILRRVVRDRKRTYARVNPPSVQSPDELGDCQTAGPFENLEMHQARQLLHALLATLDDAKREVFILAELEEMSVPEIAEATGTNLNTVYARLRSAREAIQLAIPRLQARHGVRTV